METLQILLPPELSAFVERQTAAEGHPSPNDFISSLIEAKRLEVAREELEALLEEGVNSPSRPFTPAVMDEIRQRIHDASFLHGER